MSPSSTREGAHVPLAAQEAGIQLVIDLLICPAAFTTLLPLGQAACLGCFLINHKMRNRTYLNKIEEYQVWLLTKKSREKKSTRKRLIVSCQVFQKSWWWLKNSSLKRPISVRHIRMASKFTHHTSSWTAKEPNTLCPSECFAPVPPSPANPVLQIAAYIILPSLKTREPTSSANYHIRIRTLHIPAVGP